MLIRLRHWLTRSGIAVAVFVALAATGVGANHAFAGYAAIVVDQATGQVVHECNADELNYPASLTKMMTLYLLFSAIEKGELKLNSPLKASAEAGKQPRSKVGLEKGDTIKVEDAILALVTKSANDVAVVVAEALGGNEDRFALLMTQQARKLGMKQTTFRNASGLPDPDQVSSARDLALLAIALRRDYPKYYRFFSTASFDYNGLSFANHNKLLGRYRGADGIKTGFTQASGFNLVASAERAGRRLVAVVLGGDTGHQRDRQAMRLLDGAFGVGPMPRDLKVADRGPLKVAERVAKKKAGQIASKALDLAPQGDVEGKRALSMKGATADLPASKKRFSIQVGAYDSELAAEAAIEKVSLKVGELVEGTATDVSPVKRKRGKMLYRAAFLGLSKGDAYKVCKALSRTKVPCMVMTMSMAYDNPNKRVASLKP